MDIVSALFTESFNLRSVPGPSTRIDLTGVYFSMAAPGPVPVTVEPHLMVIIRCRGEESGQGILEVVFKGGTDEGAAEVARNVSPFSVEPGKFTYRLVRAELLFETYGTYEAHCRIGSGSVTVVPITLLAPMPGAS